MAALLSLRASGVAQTQAPEKPASELRQALSRTGVYFRADAPWVLRNSDDPYLPVYLEIINGVEKAAHTTGAGLTQFIHRDPLKLDGVNVFVKPAGARHQFTPEPISFGGSKGFSWDARTGTQPLSVPDRLKKTLEIPLDAIETYLRGHFIGGPFDVIDVRVTFRLEDWPNQDSYLKVRLHAPPVPEIAHWYRGDIHYHSAFTDNPAERGDPLSVTKQVALHSGLGWVVLTDHSTDLSSEQFEAERRDVVALRDGRLVFIRGEEITAASNQDTLLPTIHVLALPSPGDPDQGFPDPEAGSDTAIHSGDGSPTSPALPLKDALRRIVAAGGFAYAAHPFDPVSPLIRGGAWDLGLDFLAPGGRRLQDGIAGLEAWNRATTATADGARDPFCLSRGSDPQSCFQPDAQADEYARLEKGIELGWRPLLLKGIEASAASSDSPAFKVFLAAGSDAHGDLNFEATLDVLDFVGKPTRGLTGYAENNAFGKLSTVVYCPQGMGPRGENVLAALRAGRSVVSNGPLLIAGFDRNSNGSLDDLEDVGIGGEISSSIRALPALQISWVSSAEFGPLESLRLILGSGSAESSAEEISIPANLKLASGGLFALDLRSRLEHRRGGWLYVRLEARTRNSAGEEFRCYTNPIWMRLTD